MTSPQTPLTRPVDALAHSRERHNQLRDIGIWLSLLVTTLMLAAVAGSFSDVVGPSTLPWWPAQDLSLRVTPGVLLAPLTAIAVLVFAARPAAARIPWHTLLVSSYLVSLMWSGSLHTNVNSAVSPTDTLGSVRLIEVLNAYSGSHAGLAITVTALSCLTVPLTLVTARSVCGKEAARSLAPVLVLGPWAAWSTLGIDGISAAACAAVLAAGALASERHVRGFHAIGGAAATGALLGAAALLSYGAAWFAVSLLCLYFARRRPGHIIVSAATALVVLGFAAVAGNSWPAGLLDTYNAAIGEVSAHPGQLWWLLLTPALVCAACGPVIVDSLRRFGSGPATAIMIGPLAALVLSPLSGANPERPEYGWVALCPWLLIAATARVSGDRRPMRAPLLSVAAGATVAIVLMWSG